MAIFIFMMALPELEEIGIVRFKSGEAIYKKEAVDIAIGYNQLSDVVDNELGKSDAFIIDYSYRCFLDYFGKDHIREAMIYRMLVTEGMNEVVTPFSKGSVFRNHFPPLDDTVQVRHHVERITKVAITLNANYISSRWDALCPDLDRQGYYEYMKTHLFPKILEARSESFIRIERIKMEIIDNLIAQYPTQTPEDIKATWSFNYGR